MRASRNIEPVRTGRSGAAALLALLVAAMLLTGCSSFRTEWGQRLPQEPHGFTEGSTRVEKVIHELGPPAQVSALPGGFVFLYEHSIVNEFQFGISLDAPLLKYLKFVHAWNNLDQEVLLLVFDDEGVLRGVDPEEWREKLGGGSAAQFIFTVMSLTDDSSLRFHPPQQDWGRLALQPLPALLNSEQSLRSGQHGLQIRLAPSYAGQQTLEMARPQKKSKKHRSQSSPR